MGRQAGFTLVELLIVVAIIAILAAVGIPSFLRARASANESATIGDMRSVVSAESIFQSTTAGYYGALSCLSSPAAAGCISGYNPGAPSFLEPSLTQATAKSGYTRTMTLAVPGPSAGLFSAYCYGAQPVTANLTGVRSFGGDHSGVLGSNGNVASCCTAAGMVDTTACAPVR